MNVSGIHRLNILIGIPLFCWLNATAARLKKCFQSETCMQNRRLSEVVNSIDSVNSSAFSTQRHCLLLPLSAFPRAMTLMNKLAGKQICIECCSWLAILHILLCSHTVLWTQLEWDEVLYVQNKFNFPWACEFQKCYSSKAVFVLFINLVATFPVFLNLVKLHPEAAIVSKHLNNSNHPYLCHTAQPSKALLRFSQPLSQELELKWKWR